MNSFDFIFAFFFTEDEDQWRGAASALQREGAWGGSGRGLFSPANEWALEKTPAFHDGFSWGDSVAIIRLRNRNGCWWIEKQPTKQDLTVKI